MLKKVYCLKHEDPNVCMQGTIAIFSTAKKARKYVEQRLNRLMLNWRHEAIGSERWWYSQHDETDFFDELYIIEEYVIDDCVNKQACTPSGNKPPGVAVSE